MLQNIKKRKLEEGLPDGRQGFTIIEVLIVLAIAALILLIVFLAVPALQRSSRNTGRRQDAGRIAAAINDFMSNSNGVLPATTTDCANIMTSTGNLNQFPNYSGCTVAAALPAVPLSPSTMYLATSTTPAAAAYTSAQAMLNVVILQEGMTCGTSPGTTTSTGANSRSIAELYTLESGTSSYQWACVPAQ